LQKGDTAKVISHIKDDFTNRVVKDLYKMHILNLIKNDPYKYLGFIPTNIGAWWNNKDTLIDIVAHDYKNIVFIDTKWKNAQEFEENYLELKSKSLEFKTTLNKKYIIFSK
jgi:hypothetical protein